MPARLFAIPVLDRWLLHAPLHQVTALVNRAALDRLRRDQPPPGDALADLWHALREEPAEVPRPREGDPVPSFLGIIPTRGCNIGCVYCNFGGPTAEMTHMDPGIAVAAIDWMAERLVQAGQKTLQIHFFGGEPFVSGELVDIVVHRTRYVCAQKGLTPRFDASTNGVFNEGRCQFVGDYFDSVVLSFDGFKEFHDRNRPAGPGRGSFEAVERTARRLAEMPIELCLRVCITQDSVAQMEAITRWMVEEFRPAIVNFESLTPGELAQKAGLQVPDPYEFAAHCIGAYRVAEELGVRATYSAAETEKNRLSFCPVGTDAMIVTLDGRMSACYLLPEDWHARGLDMEVGRVSLDGAIRVDFDALDRVRRKTQDKPARCQRCFCQWSCAGGCHVNHSYPGCADEFDEFCTQTRVVTACLLLRQLGCEDVVDELLADRPAMRALAEHPWDLFLEREEPALVRPAS